MKYEAVKAIRCSGCQRVKSETEYTPSTLNKKHVKCRRCVNNENVKVEEGWIYLLTHPSFIDCKLGKTNEPKQRLTAYNVGCPYKLYNMEFKMKVKDKYFYEEYFKVKCASLRVRDNGEWYSVPVQVGIEVLKAADEEYKKMGRKALLSY